MVIALVGARIFDGTRFLDDHAVVISGERITDVPRADALPSGAEVHRISGLLAPGFIDVQVNGGGGTLFNDSRTADGIRTISEAHRCFGTTGFLPTFISDSRARMAEAIEAAQEAIRRGVPGVLGIHLEGPFLNQERKGVHDPRYFRGIDEHDLDLILSFSEGRALVTLAPEIVPLAAIERLTAGGAIVSAGHTTASFDRMHEARNAGLTGYTHLFNAMPPLSAREPGPIGAALSDRQAWCGLIVDLHHVSVATLRIAIAAAGTERMMLVTDAMPSVGTDLEEFQLLGTTVFREDGRLSTASGTLAGSDLDMASAVRNTVRELELPLGVALQMASLNPARFLRLEGELGRIAPGYRASLVLLDPDLQVDATWIDGKGDESA